LISIGSQNYLLFALSAKVGENFRLNRRKKKQKTLPGGAPRDRHLLALALAAGLIFLAYSNPFQATFVQDTRMLLQDPRIRAVALENLKLIFQHSYWWPSIESGLYRPLTSLSYLFNYAVLGNEYHPAGYQFLNRLLHVANACLVYRLAFLLLEGVWPAFFTAALWALHPVATESVTNIVGRSDELAALALLGALLLYIRGTAEQGRRRLPWLAAAAVVTSVGVLSKESAAAVVGAAVLYDFTYRLRQFRKNPIGNAAGYAAFALPLAILGLVRASVLANSTAAMSPFVDNPLFGVDFVTARLTAIKVIAEYLWLLVWPSALSCDRSYNQIPLADWRDWGMIAALAIIAGLLAVAAKCYRRHKAVFFFIGFSALTLLPTANLIVIIGSIMAERFLYLPAIGFAACVVMAVYAAGKRFGWQPYAAPLLLSACAIALGVRTYVRNQDWKDEETLWRSAIAVSPQSFKTHFALGNVLVERGPATVDATVAEYEKATAILDKVPDRLNSTIVFNALGMSYLRKGDLTAGPERLVWFRKSLEALERCAAIDRGLSADVARQEIARGKEPKESLGGPELYNNVGIVDLRLSDSQQAVKAFQYARHLAPQDPKFVRSLANAYEAAGRKEDVVRALLEALILDNSVQSVGQVLDAYAKIDPQSCAAGLKDGQRFLNTDCLIVHHDLCGAYQDSIKTYREAKLDELARQTGAVARQQYGCAPVP